MEIKKTKSIVEISEMPDFSEFKKSQKLLYETVLSDGMDMSIFKNMMNMKRRLESGEDQYSVDVRVGQMMAEKYIDPVVKR